MKVRDPWLGYKIGVIWLKADGVEDSFLTHGGECETPPGIGGGSWGGVRKRPEVTTALHPARTKERGSEPGGETKTETRSASKRGDRPSRMSLAW